MRTKIIINQAFKDKTVFYDRLIRVKLKAALNYRKLSQEQFAHLCNKKSQNAVSKWITQNEKYRTSPSAPELLAISDVLNLHIVYFKDHHIDCRGADLNLEKGR